MFQSVTSFWDFFCAKSKLVFVEVYGSKVNCGILTIALIIKYLNRNKKNIHTFVNTTGLVFKNASRFEKIIDGIKSIGLKPGTVPLLHLENSRLYAMIHELKSLKPIYRFSNGSLRICINHLFGTENFFTLMHNPLTLRDHLKIRNIELKKIPEKIIIDLEPEIDLLSK